MFQIERTITAIDAHTAGEPIRVITAGIPKIEGKTMLEKMEYFTAHYDGLRNFLMREPRGHRDMFGAIIVPPVTEDGDLGVLYMHNEGTSIMCGHGTLGTVKVAAETGIVPVAEGKNIIKLDVPAGRVLAEAEVRGGRVKNVAFENVPAFVYQRDVTVQAKGLGSVTVDIVYGGSFYIFVEEEKLGLNICPENKDKLASLAMSMKRWTNKNMNIVHPQEPGVRDIYGVIITAPVKRTEYGCKGRQMCVFADGAVDRSPCGTGTCSRMALLCAKGELAVGESYRAASIIGTEFIGTVLRAEKVGERNAIIPKVAGAAWITGFNNFVLDSEDPLPEGFLL